MGIVQSCSPKAISDIWLKSFLLGVGLHFENYLSTIYGIHSRGSYGFPSGGLQEWATRSVKTVVYMPEIRVKIFL